MLACTRRHGVARSIHIEFDLFIWPDSYSHARGNVEVARCSFTAPGSVSISHSPGLIRADRGLDGSHVVRSWPRRLALPSALASDSDSDSASARASSPPALQSSFEQTKLRGKPQRGSHAMRSWPHRLTLPLVLASDSDSDSTSGRASSPQITVSTLSFIRASLLVSAGVRVERGIDSPARCAVDPA